MKFGAVADRFHTGGGFPSGRSRKGCPIPWGRDRRGEKRRRLLGARKIEKLPRGSGSEARRREVSQYRITVWDQFQSQGAPDDRSRNGPRVARPVNRSAVPGEDHEQPRRELVGADMWLPVRVVNAAEKGLDRTIPV